jgi:hypothetical protein
MIVTGDTWTDTLQAHGSKSDRQEKEGAMDIDNATGCTSSSTASRPTASPTQTQTTLLKAALTTPSSRRPAAANTCPAPSSSILTLLYVITPLS